MPAFCIYAGLQSLQKVIHDFIKLSLQKITSLSSMTIELIKEKQILTKITANETLLTLMAEAKSNNIWTKIIIRYYILINVICFMYMGYDKIRAINGDWRVPEAKLWLFSLLGGALGGFIAMILCRHKIRNIFFMIYFPGLAVLHLYLLYHFNIF